VHGLCPHCGAAKEGGRPVRPKKALTGDFWSDLDDAAFGGIGWLAVFPCLVLLILVVLFVVSDLLLLALGALLLALLVPLAIKLLDEH
jgi:hypothetical protein